MPADHHIDIQRLTHQIVKIQLRDDQGTQIARASLVLISNEMNSRPYGLLEDVFVADSHRHQGHGSHLVTLIIDAARKEGCYKLIATSRYTRPQVHEMYERLGFRDHGKEFRMDFPL